MVFCDINGLLLNLPANVINTAQWKISCFYFLISPLHLLPFLAWFMKIMVGFLPELETNQYL
jgi:hypothetical protein